MNGTGRPVWDDETANDDLRVLESFSDEPPRTPDILVIGGGIIGLSIAAACSARGMQVVVTERTRLAGGASGRAAGGLACDAHPVAGAEWHRYAKRSMELHRAQNDYAVEDVDLRVVPDLLIENQARVNPLEMAAALARRAGTITHETEFTPGLVVHAVGAAQTASSVKGHLIATEPASFRLGEIVATADSEFLAIQLPSGVIVAGGTKEPHDDEPDVRDGTVERIRENIAACIPDAASLEVTHAWTCFRPKSDDELPIVDRVDERTFVATGFYSTGILMAPVAGELIADAIEGRELPQAFSAKRFR